MTKKIVITGGAGFVGSNAAAYFSDQGFEVVLLDNLSRKGSEVNLATLRQEYPKIKFVHHDVRNSPEKIQPVVEGADILLHLAAQVAVTTSVVNPREDFETNALGTFNVLEAVRLSQEKNGKSPFVIFSSTNKVYGGLEDVEIDEEDTRYQFSKPVIAIDENRNLDLHSPYGCSKGSADQYVLDYSRIYGIQSAVMRMSCIYGDRQFGVEDQGWVAWFTIAAMLEKQITIYGTGKQIRDILHVSDLVRAYHAAYEKREVSSGNAFNIGGGPENTISLIELMDKLTNDFGLTLNKTEGKTRPGDQPVYVSHIGKAKEVLGWEPKVGVHEGIDKMYAWLKDNKEVIKSVLGEK